MAEPLVEVRGLKDLVAALATLGAQVKAQILADAINAGAEVLAVDMSQRAPHRSGRLGRNIETVYSIANGIAEARIGPARDVFYGGILNQGAKPHTIVPFVNRRSRRLRGKGRGGGPIKKVLASPDRIWGTKVRHPGVTADPFMLNSLAVAGPKAIEAMSRTAFAGVDRVAASVPKGG